jgi:septal ring factor EnvC (AmiA/AmiB activator)
MSTGRIWDAPADDHGVMSNAEVTRQIRAIWKNMEEFRTELKGSRTELIEHGKALAKIETGIERLVAALVLIPPRETCVRAEMRIQALEETVESIDERQQCHGCKNEENVKTLMDFKKLWEPRLWMGFGGLAIIQILVGVAVKFIK